MIIDFESLYESMQKCKNGVIWKDSTASFYLNGLENIVKLESKIKSGEYKPQRPYKFKITSPKPRDIISVGFRDRVYQRTLNDLVVYPGAIKSFIYDNMACQKGKGTDSARKRLKYFLGKMYRRNGINFYVLQCDIKGYYPNMRHDVVDMKFKSFLDTETSEKCKRILDWQYADDIGFNPGSQMVQIAGIAVLDEMDHYIKERLKIKCYIRYMDDFMLLHHNRGYLEHCKNEIARKLSEIGFELHPKKTRIYKISEDILFLGFIFRTTNTGKILMFVDPSSVKRERRKLYRLVKLYKRGKINKLKVYECYKSWKAHAQKGNSHNLIQRMDKYLKQLWEDNHADNNH